MKAELNVVKDNLSGYYTLMNDIPLTNATFNEATGWVPIGDNHNGFGGIFKATVLR
jgi:hypothetical protein